jgi:AcrR family transcriptional regulator
MDTLRNSGLRQRKRERVRAQLIEAALDLFVDRGFSATTIEDIVARVDLSPRTFFRYFETKEDVVVAGPFQVAAGLRDFARRAPAADSPNVVARNAMRDIARRRAAAPSGYRHLKLIVETPELAARMTAYRQTFTYELAEGLQHRIEGADPVLHALAIASSASAALAASLEVWIREGGSRPLLDVLEAAFAFIDRASEEKTRADGWAS